MKTDDQLFQALVSGDSRAATALYDRYFLPVRGYFINKCADPASGDDLVQETFIVVLTKPGNFKGQSSFRAYLFGVAHNVLRAHYRKHVRSRLDLVEDMDAVSVADIGPGVSTLVSQRAETLRLIQALRRINIKYQIVFEMYYWQDLTAGEIGVALELPLGTVRSRLRLAMGELLKALDLPLGSFKQLLHSVRDLTGWAREVRLLLAAK